MKQILETNNSRTCLLLYPEQIRYCCFIWNLEVTFIRRLFSQAISTFMVHSAILPVSAYEKHKCKSRNLSQLYQNYSKNENRITGQLIQRNATARNVYVPWPNINWARNKTCHSKKKMSTLSMIRNGTRYFSGPLNHDYLYQRLTNLLFVMEFDHCGNNPID